MKWIGQHIWDFVSRFRGDVYIENLSTTTETNVLVIDSDNKVSKNTIEDLHHDTSSQASVDNSGRTYIQDVTLDTYGHVTSLTSATETGQPLIYSEITITAGEMANLNTARKTLVAAQGANTMIVPVSCMIRATKLNVGVNNTTLANVSIGYGDDFRDLLQLPIMSSKGLLFRKTHAGTLHVPATGSSTGDTSQQDDEDCVDVELAMALSAAPGVNGASASKVSLLYYVATTT